MCITPSCRYLATSEATMLTLLADAAFWLLLLDAFLMAASRREEEVRNPPSREGGEGTMLSRLRAKLTWGHGQRGREMFATFIEAYQMSLATLGSVANILSLSLSFTLTLLP